MNKDQWYNVLEFSRTVHADLSNYDEDGACKYIIQCFLMKIQFLKLLNENMDLCSITIKNLNFLTDLLVLIVWEVQGGGRYRRQRTYIEHRYKICAGKYFQLLGSRALQLNSEYNFCSQKLKFCFIPVFPGILLCKKSAVMILKIGKQNSYSSKSFKFNIIISIHNMANNVKVTSFRNY